MVARNHILPLYPIGPALVAVPLVAPQVAVLDFKHPGWDRDRGRDIREARAMTKRSMAVLVALTGVMLYRVLLLLGLAGRRWRPYWRPAWAQTCGPWAVRRHGSMGRRLFSMVSAIALLLPTADEPLQANSGGAGHGLACRLPPDGHCFRHRHRRLACVEGSPRPCSGFCRRRSWAGSHYSAYNLWFFGSIVGGQARIEQYHMLIHGVSGVWSSNLLDGCCGTLFSPSRGLLVFSPWVAVAIATLAVPAVRQRLSRTLTNLRVARIFRSLSANAFQVLRLVGRTLLWSAVLDRCHPPFRHSLRVRTRLDVDAVARPGRDLGYDRRPLDRRPVDRCFLLSKHLELQSENVDLHHERLWDWRDTELSRCLIESLIRPAR